MSAGEIQSFTITLPDAQRVSALLQLPRHPRAGYVLAHGAGAGMAHPFLAAMAEGLAERNIASLRFQFPYLERGSRRVDPPPVAHAAVRAAVDEAVRRIPQVPLFAGGKSFGGRMTSQAQAQAPLPNVRGLVFIGFPLHPARKPSTTRAQHLRDIGLPMLFLQGTRDELAELSLLEPLCRTHGERATLKPIAEADHAFHVLVRSGRTDAAVRIELLDTMAAWMTARA